jgi:serine/threonine protein kinase
VENTQVGPFLIQKKLGNNRRQRVYQARQIEQNRPVALKFISVPKKIEWSAALAKINLEVTELQKLKHPGLVRVLGAGVEEKQIFFATELVEGESLATILSRRGKLPPDLAIEYGRQIAEALTYLHQQELIHAKLTPEKILITPDHQVKICDVRLNRSRRRRWDSTRLRELDLAAYLAPEQFTTGATAKSDLYSLGVILYEMVTGKLPHELNSLGNMAKFKQRATPPSITSQWLDCPIWLDKIVHQMLQPNPKKQPHTAKSVGLALEEMRKMDVSRKSSVAQMAGSFNPLNAGLDKSEAEKLLNKKPLRKKKQVPLFQSLAFLLTCFLVVIGLLVFLLWPQGIAKQMQRMEQLVNSDKVDQWTSARARLKEITGVPGPHSARANELYHLVQRKLLIHRIESGFASRLQSANVQAFNQGYRLQEESQTLAAIQAYQGLIDSIPPDDPEVFIAEEAADRRDQLISQFVFPDQQEDLLQWIALFQDSESARDWYLAGLLLPRLIIEFSGQPEQQAVVAAAREALENCRERVDNLKSVVNRQPD